MKDNIRMACNDIGQFYESRGDLPAALKYYLRNRDYSHPAKYEMEFILNILRVKINIPHLNQIDSFAAKGQKNPMLEHSGCGNSKVRRGLAARMKVCCGLAALAGGKYKMAARKFVEVEPELQYAHTLPCAEWSKHVLLPRDVALLGGLCALAAFDRDELRQHVIDESCSFRHFLELLPAMREMVGDFFGSRYSSCLTMLRSFGTELIFDVHVSPHLDELQHMIRNRALIQYISPYTRLDLRIMARAFNTDVSDSEKEVAQLIVAGRISARIDSVKKLLIARQLDERSTAFERSLSAGLEMRRSGHHLLLRTNLARQKFLSRPSSS